jgi:hypothetical protein
VFLLVHPQELSPKHKDIDKLLLIVNITLTNDYGLFGTDLHLYLCSRSLPLAQNREHLIGIRSRREATENLAVTQR